MPAKYRIDFSIYMRYSKSTSELLRRYSLRGSKFSKGAKYYGGMCFV